MVGLGKSQKVRLRTQESSSPHWEQLAQQCIILRQSLVDAWDRLSWDHQHMSRRLGVDIPEGQQLLVLVNDVRRDFLVADFLEECLLYWSAAGAPVRSTCSVTVESEPRPVLTDSESFCPACPACPGRDGLLLNPERSFLDLC